MNEIANFPVYKPMSREEFKEKLKLHANSFRTRVKPDPIEVDTFSAEETKKMSELEK